MTNKFEKEKKIIVDLIKERDPLRTAMFEKNWKRYASVIDYFLSKSNVNEKSSILDYGCGFPFVSKLLILLGYNVYAYEPYATEDELEVAKFLGVENIYQKEVEAGVTFDYVLMIDVIEHLSIIKHTMIDISNKTRIGGYLIVSTPNVLRLEMWLAFVTRRTGHPQQINTFVNSNDNYTNHQREFTMEELKYTLNHFGFKPIHATCKDTEPSRHQLNEYHQLLGKKVKAEKYSGAVKIKGIIIHSLKALFPSKLTNNLLVIAQKYKE